MNNGEQSTDNNLAREKERLEVEKLKREVIYINSPLKNPTNWVPFATLLGTSFALIWAICSGWFSRQSEYLENRKTLLAIQIDSFESRKQIIQQQEKSILDSFYFMKTYVADYENLKIKVVYLQEQDSILQSKIVDDVAKNKTIANLKYALNNQYNGYNITGFVLDSLTKRPVVNAEVSWIFADDNNKLTTTDMSGRFSFRIWGRGILDIVVLKNGYDNQLKSIVITNYLGRSIADVNFLLQRKDKRIHSSEADKTAD